MIGRRWTLIKNILIELSSPLFPCRFSIFEQLNVFLGRLIKAGMLATGKSFVNSATSLFLEVKKSLT